MYITPFEILIYKALVSEGWHVDYYIYDGSVKIHELTISDYSMSERKDFIKKNLKEGERLLNAAGVNFKYIEPIDSNLAKTIMSLETYEEVINFELDGISFGKIVERVIFRFYKSLDISKKPDVLEISKQYLITCLQNYLFSNKLMTNNHIEYILMSHGIYCTWEPVVQAAKKNKINYIAYDRAKTKETININFNQPAPDWSFDNEWNDLKDLSLTENQKNKVEEYLKEREHQNQDVYSYNFKGKEKNLSSLRKKIGIDKNDFVITFFSNLIWDAANVDRDEVFDSFYDAIKSTSEYFNNKKNIKILVRPHPAEIVLGTNQKFESFLSSKMQNVIYLHEDLQVNSFSALEITDISISHTSTIGLEAAIIGIPSVVLGKTHYRNKGFTFDPKTKDDYFRMVDELVLNAGTHSDKNKRINLAKKYFYIMMFIYQKKVPVKYIENSFDGYSYDNFETLMKKNESFKDIISAINRNNPKELMKWR